MTKIKSKREKGNDFQRWIRDYLQKKGWIVRNFPTEMRPLKVKDESKKKNLNKQNLLDVLDGVFSFYLGELGHEEDKPKIRQIEKQIVALIQKEAERDEIEASFIDIVIDLYDRLEKKKPQVTEEFIKEYAEMIDTAPHHCTRENLIGMLREAGVKVTID